MHRPDVRVGCRFVWNGIEYRVAKRETDTAGDEGVFAEATERPGDFLSTVPGETVEIALPIDEVPPCYE